MSKTSATIHKNIELPIGLDYARLRENGIRLLQKLSGDLWTDYNEHDPGVTILESLCYALTDLTNRASQPIADLLAPPPGQVAPPEATLVPPHEAFANHPVTLHDYKKIVLDHGPFRNQVVNAWVEPCQDEQAMAGEYVVYIALHYPHHEMPDFLAEFWQQQGAVSSRYLPPNHQQLAHDILRVLNQHRNLGEQFVKVIFLKPSLVSIGGHFEVQDSHQYEDTLAEILWRIDNFFETSIASRGLNYLETQGVPTEEIFAGPRLENQLLQESEFAPRIQLVTPSLLTPLLTHLDGLSSVDELHLYEPAHYPAVSPLVRISAEQELIFDVRMSLRHLTISHRGVPLRFNAEQALHQFRQLHAVRSRNLRSPIPKAKLRLELPPGRYLELGEYTSIQHSFPAVYGIGEGGPPLGASPAVRAQILQLKGYLLFFEQVMANFCAQLNHAPALLSAQHLPQGFFAQPLTDVPGIQDLLFDTPPTQRSATQPVATQPTGAETTTAPDNQVPISGYYQDKLSKLGQDSTAFMARRDTLLTHMLARFGYIISPHTPSLTAPKDIRSRNILLREQLLQHLNTATYHRGAARVHFGTGQPEASGLELFIYLLTGLRYFPLVVANGENQTLAALETEVQLGGAGHEAGRLVVHGAAGRSFAQVLPLLLTQLAAPTFTEVSADPVRVAVPATSATPRLELELLPTEHALPANNSNSPQQQVLAYLRHFDEQLNRFILLDHRTLKPATFDPAAEPQPDHPDRSFYEFEVSVCLPDFTTQFQQKARDQYGHDTYVAREYVHNLILTHAPAHLLVHVIWLDYPALKKLESLYQPFVEASGLLTGANGQDSSQLPGLQQQLTAFLQQHIAR